MAHTNTSGPASGRSDRIFSRSENTRRGCYIDDPLDATLDADESITVDMATRAISRPITRRSLPSAGRYICREMIIIRHEDLEAEAIDGRAP
jgi:hypothetical protein